MSEFEKKIKAIFDDGLTSPLELESLLEALKEEVIIAYSEIEEEHKQKFHKLILDFPQIPVNIETEKIYPEIYEWLQKLKKFEELLGETK